MDETISTVYDGDEVNTEGFIKELYIGDSWFTSMDTARNCKTRYIGIVKNASSKFPKAYLMDVMKDWPAGSYLVLETVVDDDVKLYAMGYKYCSKKVILFLFNEDAGHTECMETEQYLAHYKDDNLNTHERKIPRPNIAFQYYQSCNVIDKLNQSRQAELKLEKIWVSRCGYFRIVTTIFGICVVDCWKAYTFHCHPANTHSRLPLIPFVNMMINDIFNFANELPNTVPCDSQTVFSILTEEQKKKPETPAPTKSLPVPIISPPASSVVGTNIRIHNEVETVRSPITVDDAIIPPREHTLMHTRTVHSDKRFDKEGKEYSAVRSGRYQCKVCQKKTSWYCVQCSNVLGKKVWLCGPNTRDGRDCKANHGAF